MGLRRSSHICSSQPPQFARSLRPTSHIRSSQPCPSHCALRPLVALRSPPQSAPPQFAQSLFAAAQFAHLLRCSSHIRSPQSCSSHCALRSPRLRHALVCLCSTPPMVTERGSRSGSTAWLGPFACVIVHGI